MFNGDLINQIKISILGRSLLFIGSIYRNSGDSPTFIYDRLIFLNNYSLMCGH